MNRGEIYFADLSDVTDTTIIVPVLVISDGYFNDFMSTVLVVPITAHKGDKSLPTHINILAGQAEFRVDAYIKIERITSINKKRLKQIIGTLNDETYEIVKSSIIKYLGINKSDSLGFEDNNFKPVLNISDINLHEFLESINRNTESIKYLHDGIAKSSSFISKIKEWIISGIIGAIIGAILGSIIS